jgi:2-polyprenyl-3-methyl-5-hydroxy-6-metoxy-1,4-benzoquinol methylase
MRNQLIKVIGFTATLIQGDTLVIDRWYWLKKHLTKLTGGKLIDIGCGSGAFSLGAGKLNFDALGLSWDKVNQDKAAERARILKLENKVHFEIQDVRFLDERKEYTGKYDVAICTENIEHIINDQKLMTDMANVLKPGGLLLLTTPNYNYVPMGIGDSKKSISPIEDGGHVRIGYTPDDCKRLCAATGFEVISITYCSGFMSQKVTAFFRVIIKIFGYPVAWVLIAPFRLLPLIFDKLITAVFKWPGYSICLAARKKATA